MLILEPVSCHFSIQYYEAKLGNRKIPESSAFFPRSIKRFEKLPNIKKAEGGIKIQIIL